MTDVQPGDAWIFTDLANLERDQEEHAEKLDAAIDGQRALNGRIAAIASEMRWRLDKVDALFEKADPEGKTDPSNRRASLEQFMDYQRRLKNG